DRNVTGVQTCALPISGRAGAAAALVPDPSLPGVLLGAHRHGALAGAGGAAQAGAKSAWRAHPGTLRHDRHAAAESADSSAAWLRSEERRVGKEGRYRV